VAPLRRHVSNFLSGPWSGSERAAVRGSAAYPPVGLEPQCLNHQTKNRSIHSVQCSELTDKRSKHGAKCLLAVLWHGVLTVPDAHRRGFDAVVVWKFDRFARSVSHLLRALETFGTLDIEFVSLFEQMDTWQAAGYCVGLPMFSGSIPAVSKSCARISGSRSLSPKTAVIASAKGTIASKPYL
jgi:hypothetical protein